MELGELISLYRKEAGFTIDELVERSGVPKGTLNKIIGGTTKAPTLDNMKAIAKALGKKLADFDDEPQPEPFFSPSECKIIKKYRTLDEYSKEVVEYILDIEYRRCTAPAETEPEENIIYLPEPLQTASAGFGQLADDETSTKVAVLYNSHTAKADYIMRISGDSMEPNILDGERVLVRKQPAVEQGEIGIFIRGGERYVKIYRGDHLESVNPAYPDVPLEEFSICIGKVICRLNPDWVVE